MSLKKKSSNDDDINGNCTLFLSILTLKHNIHYLFSVSMSYFFQILYIDDDDDNDDDEEEDNDADLFLKRNIL